MFILSLFVLCFGVLQLFESFKCKKCIAAMEYIQDIYLKLSDGEELTEKDFQRLEESHDIIWEANKSNNYFLEPEKWLKARRAAYEVLIEMVRDIRRYKIITRTTN